MRYLVVIATMLAFTLTSSAQQTEEIEKIVSGNFLRVFSEATDNM